MTPHKSNLTEFEAVRGMVLGGMASKDIVKIMQDKASRPTIFRWLREIKGSIISDVEQLNEDMSTNYEGAS